MVYKYYVIYIHYILHEMLQEKYDADRLRLAGMFKKNYNKYIIHGVTDYSSHGPQV